MSAAKLQPLPEPPLGFRLYRSTKEILGAADLFAYQHLLLRAWDELKLNAVLAVDGLPTVYISDSKRSLTPRQAAELHGKFWNQGVATVLLLRDPERIRVLSAMTAPLDPAKATELDLDALLVQSIEFATQATWMEKFYLQLGTGHYYSDARWAGKFDPKQTVDAYLLDNLEAMRDALTRGPHKLLASSAHAFLGRILFTCYLCHRGIIKLSNYFPHKPWNDLRDMLADCADGDARPALYGTLFEALKREFNSSMFDDDLAGERRLIQPGHLDAIRRFLDGDEVRKGQRTLGFWAYDFSFIPVETISSIYEKFLDAEDGEQKRDHGAYYTPRFLAEMTLDLALKDHKTLNGLRFLDPSCGSGIFLVLLFNRLAAEWRAAHTQEIAPAVKAAALRERMRQLRGVDRDLRACRIACFSLYLAYLDQLDLPDVRDPIALTGEKLPTLVCFRPDRRLAAPVMPVLWERDFFEVAEQWRGQFHIIVGNPPWSGRGNKQIAHQFMEAAPGLLAEGGCAALILPSKVFLNKTDALQSRWLRRVTLETVVQLADYRFILFKEALCPAAIVRFTGSEPPPDHKVDYVTPKVTRTDLRDGVIPVSAQDQKQIRLSWLLRAAEQGAAGVAWKTRLWGTARDQKLLDYLFTLPRLGHLTDLPSKRQKRRHRWVAGQGCKPWSLRNPKKPDRALKGFGRWTDQDELVNADDLESLIVVPRGLCSSLADHFRVKGYVLGELYSKPPDELFQPPLVLLNQGFSEAAFFDRCVRFQHSLQSITAGDGSDTNELIFLAAFLRSKLARYFVFHTAANIGTERDKVHMEEALRLPFFLPDHEDARPECAELMEEIVSRVKRLKNKIDKNAAKLLATRGEWHAKQQSESRETQAEIEPLIYRYFDLTEQDIALVEDTCDIFDKSDTPGTLNAAASIPTLAPLAADNLQIYADMLTAALNGWATGAMRVSAMGAVDPDTSLALVELRQTRTAQSYQTRSAPRALAEAIERLQQASAGRVGDLAYLRGGWYLDRARIILVKPARRGEWTRTAALNDAAELYGHIAETGRAKPQPPPEHGIEARRWTIPAW